MRDTSSSDSGQDRRIQSVFLSYHFAEEVMLVNSVSDCIKRQGLEIITGVRLGGAEVSTEVRNRIRNADSLIALMTRRYRLGAPTAELWDTYPWVRDELTYSYQLNKTVIALVEDGVEMAGAFSTYERIQFDRDNWDKCLHALDETLILWTGELGLKPLQIRLFPEKAAEELRRNRELRCRYRWIRGEDQGPEEWRDAHVNFVTGATFLIIRRPPADDALVEIAVLDRDEVRWRSFWQPLMYMVTLERDDRLE